MSLSSFVPYAKPAAQNEAASRATVIDPRLSRTSYYDGRLLRASDLLRDAQYLDARLREVGRALGHGVISGLELTLSGQSLTVTPGTGITRAGRVLLLERSVSVDLANRAELQSINGLTSGRLAAGLYAVVLRLAEIPRGVAEVFPSDLATRAKPQPDSIVEGVSLDLVRLDVALPRLGAVQARAALAPSLTAIDPPQLPEDGVALGVLAVRDDRPEWLDARLLRHAPRSEEERADSAALAEHYAALFRDIRTARLAAGLPELEWAARDYFSTLPPVGPVPKDSVNPVEGWQAFFPAHFTVHAAPVREDEWEVVRREALALEPLSLTSGAPAHVLVLVRLGADDFARYAPALNDEPEARFPLIDPLKLRFTARASLEAALDTDSVTWGKIWNAVSPEGVWFVRRAVATAGSQAMAVLAKGISTPSAPEPSPLPESPSFGWTEVDALLQARIPSGNSNAVEAAQLVLGLAAESKNPNLQSAIVDAFFSIDRRFDEPLWLTLALFVKQEAALVERIKKFANALRAVPAGGDASPIKHALEDALSKAEVEDPELAELWIKLANFAEA